MIYLVVRVLSSKTDGASLVVPLQAYTDESTAMKWIRDEWIESNDASAAAARLGFDLRYEVRAVRLDESPAGGNQP